MPDTRTPEQVQAELAEVDAALDRQENGDPPPVVPDQSPDPTEVVASRYGWVPKDKYRGNPDNWKPADQFMDDGLKFNKNIKRELDQVKASLAENNRVGQAFAKFHEEAMAKKDQEIKDAIAETRRQLRVAVREGNDDLAETLEAREELLREEQANLKAQKVEPPTSNVIKPDGSPNEENLVLTEWIEDGNMWFRENVKLRNHAISLGQQMRAAGDTTTGRRFLDAVAQQMREDFPRHFAKKDDPPPPRADQVETGTGRSDTGRTGITVHDLPAEDLKLMREFIAKGWTTQEKFLANYASGGKRTHRTKS